MRSVIYLQLSLVWEDRQSSMTQIQLETRILQSKRRMPQRSNLVRMH